MKKPKIAFHLWKAEQGWFCCIVLENTSARLIQNMLPFATRKAAREWAKEWCLTVGAALMERGGRVSWNRGEKGK